MDRTHRLGNSAPGGSSLSRRVGGEWRETCNSLNPALSVALLAACLATLSLCGSLLSETVLMALRYDRAAIIAGEWWRVLSGHMLHGGFAHWASNMAGFALILFIYAKQVTGQSLVLAILELSLMISAGLFIWNPGIDWYVGFSGVLHGLFAMFAMQAMFNGSHGHGLAAALLVVKIAYEQLQVSIMGTQALIGLPVITDAHLYGALSGLVLVLVHRSYGCRVFRSDLSR